jgi:hypothetical protein
VKEVFKVPDPGQLYRAFQRVMTGTGIAAVSRGLHDGREAITVEWEHQPRENEVLKIIEEIEALME